MSVAVQDVIVTAMAMIAALIILGRMIGTFRPGKANPACDNCASGAAACAKVAATQGNAPVPLVLHRRS